MSPAGNATSRSLDLEPVFRPTPEQELLLRAASWRGPEGLDAWARWRAQTRVDALDPDSQWLLPLLYQNLRMQNVPSGLLTRYRNVYLHNWYKNTLTLRQAQPALVDLEGLGLPVVLLEGAAMALGHYEALGARPFGPLRVLALRAAMPSGASRPPAVVVPQASLFDPWTDADLIQRATAVRWQARRHLVLDPADQLVDLCVRRRRWDQRSRLLWIADAVTLVRRNPVLSWDRVIALAIRVARRHEVAGALGLLQECLGLDLPEAVRDALPPVVVDRPT